MFEIEILNPVIQNSFTLFKIKNTSNTNWNKVKLNFLASTREDIDIGYAEISKPNYQSNRFTIDYPIQKQFTNASSLKVKAFVKSLNVESVDKQFIGLFLKSISVSTKNVSFEYLSPNNQSIIKFLSISVVVFDMNSPGILFADGEIGQNYVVSKMNIAIPRHGVNELRTYMIGLNSFYFSIAQPINLFTEITDKFSLTIGPMKDCDIDYLAVSYLILSVVDCGYCTGYPYKYNGTCLQRCPLGTILKNKECIPINCVKGYVINRLGQCVPECGKNQ